MRKVKGGMGKHHHNIITWHFCPQILSSSTKQGHMTQQLLSPVLIHTIISHGVLRSKREGKICSCGYQYQMLHIWQSTINKTLISSHSVWNQCCFQICFLCFAPILSENQKKVRSAEEELNHIWEGLNQEKRKGQKSKEMMENIPGFEMSHIPALYTTVHTS